MTDDDLMSEIDSLASKAKEETAAGAERGREIRAAREQFVAEFLAIWDSTIRPAFESVCERLKGHEVRCDIDGPGDHRTRGPRYEHEVAITIHGLAISAHLSLCPEDSMVVTVGRSQLDGRNIAQNVKLEELTSSFITDQLRELIRTTYGQTG